ncbi:MAG: ribonuclease D [Hyphomicrobiales bacterium]|nr:ribonuclease D [Hyphomicrobiales bacterium]
MKLVDSTAALAEACALLKSCEFVTVDTEFHRETTFWPKLCLIQIAGGPEAFAIDALAPRLDLEPFLALMRDPGIIKVFHAARQDLEILWKLSGFIPAPLFDTQIAAMVCGYGDQVSYGELVRQCCGLTIDKSSRFTDWAQRPLSAAQLDYAIADVTHLQKVYRNLRDQLQREKRLGWLDEDLALLKDPETYKQSPERAWERFRSRARKPRDIAVLMELAQWREREAQERDIPRGRVLKDDLLIEIALAAPKDAAALAQLRSVPRGMERAKAGMDILAAVAAALQRDPKTLPVPERHQRNGASGATVELLKVLLRQVSEAEGVAPRVIATTDDLEDIAASDHADCLALHGWRREIFGSKALELKHGRLALTLEEGRVITLEWQDAGTR